MVRTILLLLWLALPAWALDITTNDGTVYQSCEVTRVDPDGVSVTYSDGVVKIPFSDLPPSLRKKYEPHQATPAPEVAAGPAAQSSAMLTLHPNGGESSPGASPAAALPLDSEFETDHGFTVRLTSDWMQVPADLLQQLDEKMALATRTKQDWEYAYQLKHSAHWLAYPYILVKFIPGRQSEAVFKEELQNRSQIQKGMDGAAQRSASLISSLRVSDVTYDESTHTGEGVTVCNVNGIGTLEAFTALRLVQTGVIEMCGYCIEGDKDRYLPFFKHAAGDIEVSSGKYSPGGFEGIPLLGSINWMQIAIGAVIGGIIGAFVSLFGKRLVDKA